SPVKSENIASQAVTRLSRLARTMSSTATTPSSVGVAPWRPLFQTHVSKMDSPEFVFSSLHPAPKDSPVSHLPRARYCIYRGMWAELPENKHNDAPRNKRVYESDLLTLTTDVRMEKVPEIFASSQGHGAVSQSQGSGGGGPVEAVFWVKEVMTQWRFRGEAFIVAKDVEGDGEESSGVRTLKSQVGERMRVVDEEAQEGWSWNRELTAHFGNLSPGMRGTFKNPAPGTPVGSQPGEGLGLGQKVSDLEDEVARKNFRVVIIKPAVVELCDLSDPERARRWRYTFVGQNSRQQPEEADIIGEWIKEELWP
ncbi:zn 2cys6 transcription factor, partial [Diplocarpon rosae]